MMKTIVQREHALLIGIDPNSDNNFAPDKLVAQRDEIIISGNKYWYWVNYGREPGKKPPPPDKILEWMKVRGLDTEKTDKANMFKAFRIAAKIGREGIQGTKFVDEVSQNIIASLTKEIGDSYILKINNSFNGNS